ncbi:hypothetical protein EL17_02000 [Anditalea andensis]|uniref:Glycosyl transferase family 28 C-terminal domain-containing protein n=2 Tax=Anditalea andensis TaxID=1048983 RepID=A0A074L4B8_9BACT|nr:hypothetical protein EL17_02000 [Anditalea andensis]
MPVFTSSKFQFGPNVEVIEMPAEDPDGTAAEPGIFPPPDYLHYSPVGQKSIQERSALFLKEILHRSIRLVIIDVSVEMAALCRAASIPYAYVRLPGNRNDPAHLQAFQGATFLLAYYPADLDGPEIPQWVKQKTIYTGFFSRFKERSNSITGPEHAVCVFTGSGGNSRLVNYLPKIAARFSDRMVDIYGNVPKVQYADNICYKGIHPDPQMVMSAAGVVVANCGLNLTSEILSLGRSFIAIPEDRPYDEQYGMHRFLTSSKLAIDWSTDWDFEKLAGYKISDVDRFIDQNAPNNMMVWMEHFQYQPSSLKKSISTWANVPNLSLIA